MHLTPRHHPYGLQMPTLLSTDPFHHMRAGYFQPQPDAAWTMRPTTGVSMMQPKKEQAGLAEIVLEPLGMNALPESELCVGVVAC